MNGFEKQIGITIQIRFMSLGEILEADQVYQNLKKRMEEANVVRSDESLPLNVRWAKNIEEWLPAYNASQARWEELRQKQDDLIQNGVFCEEARGWIVLEKIPGRKPKPRRKSEPKRKLEPMPIGEDEQF